MATTYVPIPFTSPDCTEAEMEERACHFLAGVSFFGSDYFIPKGYRWIDGELFVILTNFYSEDSREVIDTVWRDLDR